MANKNIGKPLKILRKINSGPVIQTTADLPVNIDDKLKNLNRKQQHAVKLLIENPTASKAEILRQSGYSEKGSVIKPAQVFDQPEVKEAIDTYVDRLRSLRDKVTEHLARALEDPKKILHPRDAVSIMDVLTKNIQLLSGKATDNFAIVVREEHRRMVEDILLENIPEDNDTETTQS